MELQYLTHSFFLLFYRLIGVCATYCLVLGGLKTQVVCKDNSFFFKERQANLTVINIAGRKSGAKQLHLFLD